MLDDGGGARNHGRAPAPRSRAELRAARDLPERFRGQPDSGDPASLADLPWWDVFGYPSLQRLVREALENNYDLKTAIARVEQFRAQVGVAASDLYPHAGDDGSAAREKAFLPIGGGGNRTTSVFSGLLDVAWESSMARRASFPRSIAIIKTQGSDTKLVGQMQPYYEAKGLSRWELGSKSVPPFVCQIADGENGGVMMNEFPPKYCDVVRECSASDTPLMNATEYLEHLFATGVRESDLPVLQPLFQKRVWERFQPGGGPEALARVIEELRRDDSRFHVEGGSWTNNISWVRGYDALLGPMERASSLFYQKILEPGMPTSEYRYRNALFHLLASQTSCCRYWGRGVWVEYGREICRRTTEILKHDF